MVLIEGTRGGNQGMTVEPPLIVYEAVNVYTKEVRELYEN
jgi:tRNA1(Val) A37 N6-methylase TrmN6